MTIKQLIKILSIPILMAVIWLATKPIHAAMIPNVDYPPNQATNLWTQPVLTYNGQYVISLNGSSNTQSKSVAISIPMQDVMYFTFTYYDINMNAKEVTSLSNGFNQYENVLINHLGNNFDIYVQSLENEVSTWRLEVFTIFNYTAGGGNTATWRTNILDFAYISQSPLFGQFSVISEVIYKAAYDKGFQNGEDYGYQNGEDYGYDNGYIEGSETAVTKQVNNLFEAVMNWIGSIFQIEILPGVRIGYFVMIPITFGLFNWFMKMMK